MISICIPVYNYQVVELINSLIIQINKLNEKFEIIVIDDGSNDKYIEDNASISNMDKVQYITLKDNVGRSKIRNLFLEKATFEHLLFIDCDCSIPSKNYLSNYINYLHQDVVYGGRKHRKNQPEDISLKLRWKYGVKIEDQSFKYRLKNPYHSFKSNNFLIRKSIFSKIRFNENITSYGHEDTQLSLEFKKNKIKILQIDNVVYHDGIENNKVFLKKSHEAIKNLLKIEKLIEDSSGIKLVNSYKKITKLKLEKVLSIMYKPLTKTLEKQLLSNWPSIKIFSLYKLLIEIKEKENV